MRKIPVIFLGLIAWYHCTNSYSAEAASSIKVFFNQPESAAPSKSEIANPDKGIDDALVEFLQTAKSPDSVYLCFYDDTTEKITDAFNNLIATVGDGNIYHIMDEENGGNSNGSVDNPGVYSFTNSIDDGTDGSPLMHNKFAVIIDTAAQTGRVWTGSYNPTDNGASRNNNNALWIESYQLAKIFADEFIYMWNGGSGKFSADKSTSNNTAKTVTVGDTRIDVYFSPYTDSANTNTSMVLEDLIDGAAHSVFFNMFTFSVNETRIKEAVKDAYNRGLEVKGVVEATQSSAVQSEFRRFGIEVALDANDKNLHHKFCIIDYGASYPKVITGSYNWTSAAKETNDENFLVIHSREVADLYWKEFHKNYTLAGGIAETSSRPAVSEVLVYPSPAKNVSEITIGYTLTSAVTDIIIKAYTLTGERVISFEPEFYAGTYNEKRWDLKNSDGDDIAPGLYIIKVEATTGDGTFTDTEKFVVIK